MAHTTSTVVKTMNVNKVAAKSVDFGEHLFGHHETEVMYCDEMDMDKNLIMCTKNPGHVTFIRLDSLSLEHLPEGYRDLNLLELIKVQADLTVKVDVKSISSQRPERWPKTEKAYPFGGKTVGAMVRSGSGRVRFVYKYTKGNYRHGSKPWTHSTVCTCSKCQMFDTPRNVWWEVFVYTAAHVVFDADEAKHTSVRLFYDTPDCPGVVLDKVSVEDVNIERDWCILKCVTCDEILGERLTALLDQFEALTPKVLKYYRKSGHQEKLTFMISHPHGCPKKVSFGATVDRYQVGLYKYTKLTYTTSSCPGSSGAAVCCIEGQGSDFVLRHVIHSGCLDRSLNVSGAGVM